MEGLKALGGGAGGGRILQIHRRYACKEVNGHNNHWNSWYRRIVGLEINYKLCPVPSFGGGGIKTLPPHPLRTPQLHRAVSSIFLMFSH